MKRYPVVALFFWSATLSAQKDIKPSDEFAVSGQVIHELKFTLADLEKLASKKN